MFNLKKTTVAVASVIAVFPLIGFAAQGLSSSADAYVQPVANGVEFTSILTAADLVNGYRMTGLPDGLGAYANDANTFTVLMNHEIPNTSGTIRAHGAIGSFVSEWVIDKNTLEVISGGDLIKQVFAWNATTQTSSTAASTVAFSRFCSADLPAESAFYDSKSRLGTKARIFMNGEEGGATGYAVAHVASGKNKGNSYVLGKFNLATNGSGGTAVGGWENLLANPKSGKQTVVIGTNDGGTGIMNNSVAVYIGSKTNAGSEADKAGLTNGTLKFINVAGLANDANSPAVTTEELANTTTRASAIVSGTAFTLSDTTATTFSRPEDGAWSADGKAFYFVTTDRLDNTDLAKIDPLTLAIVPQTQIGGTRLWRLNFNATFDGGTIDLLIDTATMAGGIGNTKPNMWDNLSVNKDGTLTLLEDVGNAEHNGKIWQYKPSKNKLEMLGKFDAALFGDIDPLTGLFTAGAYTKDEETSGVIDITGIMDRSDDLQYSLMVVQNHASAASLQTLGAMDPLANPVEIYEGGQLVLMSRTPRR